MIARFATRAFRALRRLRLTDWGWLQFKIVLGLAWPITLLRHPPTASAEALGPVFVLVALMMLAGSAISISGLFLSRQPGSWAVIGLTVETVGLMFVVASVVSYWFTQVAIIAGSPPEVAEQRYAFTVYAYAMGTAVVARLLIILTARHDVASGKSRRVV